MKIEIYKDRELPMLSIDGELYNYDDYALRTIALMIIDNKYDGINAVETILKDDDLIGIKKTIDKLVLEILDSNKTYEDFMKDFEE